MDHPAQPLEITIYGLRGTGTWQGGEYVWQPGYWYEGNPNWVWVPNHYSYTPRGYCYVSGYWDYLPYDRGLLYAPVYWGAGYRGGYGYGYYRPQSIVNTALVDREPRRESWLWSLLLRQLGR